MFYAIPCVQNMIAALRTDFIGKMMRGPPNQPSQNMISACCGHKRRVGRSQTTGKIFMVKNLRLLFRDVNTVHINCFGSLQDWINEASNKTTGTNSSNAFFILTRRYQSNPKHGDRCHRGAHDKLLTDSPPDHNADDDNDNENSSNAGSNHADGNRESHREEGSHGQGQRQHPPLPRRAPPTHKQQQSQFNPPPLLNTIKSSGSTMKISAYKLDAACSNHSRFSVSDSERLKPKLKSTIDNLPANIILTRMILQSLVSPHLKLLLSSSS